MDNSYFYIILRFRRLSETSSSRSIRRLSGDNEFYSLHLIGKGYMLIFFIFGLSAIRPRPVWTYLKAGNSRTRIPHSAHASECAYAYLCHGAGCFHVHVKMLSVFLYTDNKIKYENNMSSLLEATLGGHNQFRLFSLWLAFPIKRKRKKGKYELWVNEVIHQRYTLAHITI